MATAELKFPEPRREGPELSIVGLDPGYASFGASSAVLTPEGLKYRRVEVWHTDVDHSEKRKADDASKRLRFLADSLRSFLWKAAPHLIAVEIQASGGNTCRRCNPHAKFTVQTSVLVINGRVRGILDGFAEILSVPVLELAPTAVKSSIAGAANATKGDVWEALEQKYPGAIALFPRKRGGGVRVGDMEHGGDACALIHAAVAGELAQGMWRGILYRQAPDLIEDRACNMDGCKCTAYRLPPLPPPGTSLPDCEGCGCPESIHS